MHPFPSRAAAGLLVAAALTAVTSSCDQSSPEQTCAGASIPSNACPFLEDDSECNDPCCAAAYQCTGGAWALVHPCAGYSASKCPDASGGAVGPAVDSGPCDASVVLPPGANGGPGCAPLQGSDCPLGEVLSCGVDACLQFGCDSLFYCDSNGDWIFWGACEDGGVVQAGIHDGGGPG
jgi:hypothetical protein